MGEKLMERTCRNGTLRLSDAGKQVTLIGWVSKRRNLGALVFVDLRDRSGIVQIVFDENLSPQVKEVRSEYILQVTGTVIIAIYHISPSLNIAIQGNCDNYKLVAVFFHYIV